MADLLKASDGLATKKDKPAKGHFYGSDAQAGFVRTASLFLGEQIEDMVERVDISRY